MSDLKGKVAIVTGASKGIGAGIAKGFAAAGAAVVVNYASSREGADRVVADITAQGGKAIAVQGDVSKAADVKRLFEQTRASFGALDVLVNNAGVYQFGPLETVTEKEFHREFDTNVLGTILTIREALKYFGPHGGSVINISSIASLNPTPDSVVYAATKSAVDSITRSLSKELGARKIRVNAIAPGGTASEGLATAGILGSDFEKQIIGMTPLGRLGQPEDIARVAVFLASDASSWLTGERITASGGWR
jgi:3-oxoacyl-[acyl-carrier protein] reductase